MADFTHFDSQGNAIMVDVSGKQETDRRAVAKGRITMNSECFEMVKSGSVAKGDVLGVARVAGLMALKQTTSLIPLCHPLPIQSATIDFNLVNEASAIDVTCTALTHSVTGVEMEVLTGVSLTLLTIYDMCKALDKSMVITDIRLMEKSGGKSGEFRREREI